MGRRIKRVPALPPVKWAGGKRGLLPELLARVPEDIGTYHEPFVGGGALFFALASERRRRFQCASIGDVNARLINMYLAIQDDSHKVIRLLREHEANHHGSGRHARSGKKYFQRQREREIDRCKHAEQAAWLIYLNKTCFNGLYRVNSRGIFNVPFGRYAKPNICDEKNLIRCAMALIDVKIRVAGFESVLNRAKAGDFVYFDPPYYPTSKTSSFTRYAVDDFGDRDHVRLAEVAYALKEGGVRVLISNSDTPRVREIFGGFRIEEVSAKRSIHADGKKRGKVTDLLIS